MKHLGGRFLIEVFDIIVDECKPIICCSNGLIYESDITDELGLIIENTNYYEIS